MPGGLGALFLLWALHTVSGQGSFLYKGGFLLVAAATAAVILVVVVVPEAPMARALSWGVLGYVGRISYGLYLYHYPLFLMIDGERTGLSGAGLLAARLGATFAVAVLSYHLVEMPIRQRRALRGWHLLAALPIGVAVVGHRPGAPDHRPGGGARQADEGRTVRRAPHPAGGPGRAGRTSGSSSSVTPWR